MTKRNVEEEKQYYFIKSYYCFNDKRIQLAIYKYISYSGYKLLAQKLAKVVGDYLGSQIVRNIVWEIFKKESTPRKKNIKQLPSGLTIRVWTTWN